MLRDFKFLRRNSGKHNEEIENVPANPRDSLGSQASTDSSRPPLNTIQHPPPTSTTKPNPSPKLDQEARTRVDRTPTKPKFKTFDPLRTPDKHAVKQRFGWAQSEMHDEMRTDGRGALPSMTPRSTKTVVGKANSSYSESNSTQSTPTKSVSKPPNSGFRIKGDGNNGGGGRSGNFNALYRGIPVSSGGGFSATIVNTVDVPHFDLKEDPSFWMDHNVQV